MFKFGWILAVATLFTGSGVVYMDTIRKVADHEAVLVRGTAVKDFVDEDWASAEIHFTKAVSGNDEDSHAWFMLAFAQHYQGKYDIARKHFLKSKELGACEGLVHYNLACGYAMQNNPQAALREFKTAVDLNFKMYEHATVDPDLDSLRQLPEFKIIMDELATKSSVSVDPDLPFSDR